MGKPEYEKIGYAVFVKTNKSWQCHSYTFNYFNRGAAIRAFMKRHSSETHPSKTWEQLKGTGFYKTDAVYQKVED